MIKKLVLYYFYTFLILDSLMGFLLKYLNLDLFLNPGQIVRGSFLILLLVAFFYDLQKSISKLNIYLLLFLSFVAAFLAVQFAQPRSLSLHLEEISRISKVMFFVFLLSYVYKHYEFFREKLEGIILSNFCVFSGSLILGYFTKQGLQAYTYMEETSKGMFYGGNPVSILSLVFFTYYLFNLSPKIQNILYVMVALFNIHITSSKAVFVVPLIILIYMFNKAVNMKFSKKMTYGLALIPILLLGYVFVIPKIVDLYETRYSRVVRRSYNAYLKKERVLNTPLTAPMEMIAYRRVDAAKTQTEHLLKNPKNLFLGMGYTGLSNFWIEREKVYHDASMDVIDMIFKYGILGCLLIFFLIFKTVFYIIRHLQKDRDSIIVMFMFLYSFFGGHVIASMTSGTVFALFIGIKYGSIVIGKELPLKNPALAEGPSRDG